MLMRVRSWGVCAAVAMVWCVMGVRPAAAEPLTWNLVNLSFDYEGGVVGQTPGSITATGWFTYDADTHTYSNWDITVTGGTDALLDKTYTPSDSYVPSLYTTIGLTEVEFVFLPPGLLPNFNGDYVNGTQTTMLELDYHDDPYGTGLSTDPGLTDQGGSFSVETGATFLYDYSDSTHYDVRTGSLSATMPAPTPEPSSGVLAGTGAVMLAGLFARRRVGELRA